MSCLRLAPSWRWASGIVSRRRQKRLALRSGSRGDGIAHEPALDRGGERRPRNGPRDCASADASEDFGEHVPGVRRVERVARARHVADDELEGDARHEFEGRDRVALRLAQHAEERQRGGRRVERDEGGRHGRGPRKQPSVAAVTTPSVPSAPMNSCLRS